MIHWLVAKAVLGLKGLIMAGVSLLSSADWSPGSSGGVHAFLAERDDRQVKVVVTIDEDAIQTIREDIDRIVEIQRIVRASVDPKPVVRVVCVKNRVVHEAEAASSGGCHAREI